MIKAVLFDYGGVMSDGGRGVELTDRLAANLNITPEQALEILSIGWTEYSSGRISEDELWKLMEKAYGSAIPPEKRNIWNSWDIMKPKPEMVAYVEKLRADGLRVGLLSNVVPYTMDQIRAHGGYDTFDFTVLSAEVGFGKPELKIYQLALDNLPDVKAEEVIFVDDQERFLVPAQKLGMQTVLASTPNQIIDTTNHLIESLKHAA